MIFFNFTLQVVVTMLVFDPYSRNHSNPTKCRWAVDNVGGSKKTATFIYWIWYNYTTTLATTFTARLRGVREFAAQLFVVPLNWFKKKSQSSTISWKMPTHWWHCASRDSPNSSAPSKNCRFPSKTLSTLQAAWSSTVLPTANSIDAIKTTNKWCNCFTHQHCLFLPWRQFCTPC